MSDDIRKVKNQRQSLEIVQLHDSIEKLRETMKEIQMQDPFKEARESLKAIQMHDPLKEFRESLKTMQTHDHLKEFRETLKAMQMHDPLKEAREALKTMQMHDHLKEFRETLKAMQLHDPFKEARETLKAMRMHDPLKGFRESLREMQTHDPLKELRESLKSMQTHDPLKELRESMKAVRIFGEFVSNSDWSPEIKGESGIEISADGTLIINSKLVTQEQVQEIAQSVISKALNDSSYVFEQKINKLIQEIRALKDPVIQSVIAWLIYPLIVGLVLSVINPVTDFYIKERLSKNEKRLIVEEVSKTLNKTLNDQTCLSSFRIISATSLNIRKSGSSKSDIIATLFLGDVVEIIKKEQKWFLISWRDAESETTVQGWAYSQYLKAIK
jgi:hypothetical protein